jgi:molybdopterin-guanine dinucleotide biosynthesis protein A
VLHPFDGSSANLRLGVILAGGRSRRFGSPKALAELGGAPVIERVATAVRSSGAHAVLISGPGMPDLRHLLPCRDDARPGLGPLAGLETALEWAGELGLAGALCVACDTPFLAPALLRAIAERGESGRGRVVAPESEGPLGVEPLCAWYPVTALQEIRDRLDNRRLSLAALLEAIPMDRIPIDEVRTHGDPGMIFLNINTVADRDRAAEVMARRQGTAADA